MDRMAPADILLVEDHLELAQLLAAALEARGLTVRSASTGSDALDEIDARPPAAALVDLLLPDMLGTRVLAALAACEPPVPTFAMSGVFRGHRYEQEAVVIHRARAFFEKPFSTKAVVDAIAEVVEAGAPPEPEEVDIVLTEVVEPGEDEGWEFLDAATILGEEDAEDEADDDLDAALDAALDATLEGASETETSPDSAPTVPVSRPPPSPAAERARRRRREMGFVEDLIPVEGRPRPTATPAHRALGIVEDLVGGGSAPAPRPTPPRPAEEAPAPPAHRGDLATTSVPRLLAAFHHAGSSGLLRLDRGPVTKVVHLVDGRPVYAASNLAGDRLLTFGVRRGLVRREDAEAALRLARDEQRRVGELLVELGVLDRPALRRLVLDQVRAILWSTFAWTEGTYEIKTAVARAHPVTLDLGLAALVLEGLRRAVPLVALREAVPDDRRLAPAPAPFVPLEDVPLSGEDASLVAQADGLKSVADLLALSEGEERDVRALLLTLESFGILAPRAEVEERTRRIGFLL